MNRSYIRYKIKIFTETFLALKPPFSANKTQCTGKPSAPFEKGSGLGTTLIFYIYFGCDTGIQTIRSEYMPTAHAHTKKLYP